MLTTHRNACGVNLRVAGVCKGSTALVGSIGGGDIATHRVGGKIEDWTVAAGSQNHRIS